jgi:hypothetical protein
VWQRLVDELHAQVGESTVRRYVAEVRRRQLAVLVEVKVPEWHPPGAEAEVDFGQIGFWLDGVLSEGWMFVFRLSVRQGVPPRLSEPGPAVHSEMNTRSNGPLPMTWNARLRPSGAFTERVVGIAMPTTLS